MTNHYQLSTCLKKAVRLSLIPWEATLLDYLTLSPKTTHLLVVLQRKIYKNPFNVPFQEIYEGMIPEDALGRYNITVDGEVLDGRYIKYFSGVVNQPPEPGSPNLRPITVARPHEVTLSNIPKIELFMEIKKRALRRLKRYFGR